MKKLALTIAIVLGISISSFAQGGLFQYGDVSDENYYGSALRDDSPMPLLPQLFGSNDDESAAPLGTGALLLISFGAAYALKKRNKD